MPDQTLHWPTVRSKLIYNGMLHVCWHWLPWMSFADQYYGNWWYFGWGKWMWFGGRAEWKP